TNDCRTATAILGLPAIRRCHARKQVHRGRPRARFNSRRFLEYCRKAADDAWQRRVSEGVVAAADFATLRDDRRGRATAAAHRRTARGHATALWCRPAKGPVLVRPT